MNLDKIMQGLASSGALSGFAGGLAGGALAGAISSKKGRNMAKGALQVGAVAAVGGLAYSAYRRYRQNSQQLPATAGGLAAGASRSFTRWDGLSERRFETAAARDSNALLIVRSMIAAASADGHFDSSERERVFAEARKLDLTAAEKAMLFDEIQNPATLPEIVAGVGCPELAVEIYAASVVAVDDTQESARAWLASLALALELPDELVASVHTEVSETRFAEVTAA